MYNDVLLLHKRVEVSESTFSNLISIPMFMIIVVIILLLLLAHDDQMFCYVALAYYAVVVHCLLS